MSTPVWDSHMKPENVLCAIDGGYPFHEKHVLPGTNWEIAQYSEHEFYAYRLETHDEDGEAYLIPQLVHIKDEHTGFDAAFSTYQQALDAILQCEKHCT